MRLPHLHLIAGNADRIAAVNGKLPQGMFAHRGLSRTKAFVLLSEPDQRPERDMGL